MLKKDFFDCERIYKALSLMRKGKTSIETLDITEEEIKKLIELGINIVNIPKTNAYYIESNDQIFEIISLKNKKEKLLKWAEVGPIFAGHLVCDISSLDKLLTVIESEGVEEVHFSGDLCAGPPPKATTKNNDWKYWKYDASLEQAKIIVDVLSKHSKLTYYTIHGENELAFEKDNQINPLIIIQRDLNAKGITFYYKPTMTLNIVIDGIVKRITYLRRKRTYTISYQSEFYMDEQYAKMVNNVVINGKQYKLMFVQFGGTLENSVNKNGDEENPIYLTTNSGFLRDTMGLIPKMTTYPSIRINEVTIKDAKLISKLKTKTIND